MPGADWTATPPDQPEPIVILVDHHPQIDRGRHAILLVPAREICRLIRDAGWIPAQRDQYYRVLHRHDGADSPDLRVNPDPPMRNVRKIDKQYVGAAPGLDDGADRSMKVQLPILGEVQASN